MNTMNLKFTFTSQNEEEITALRDSAVNIYKEYNGHDLEDHFKDDQIVLQIISNEAGGFYSFEMILHNVSIEVKADWQELLEDYPTVHADIQILVQEEGYNSDNHPLYYLIIGKRVFPVYSIADEIHKKNRIYEEISKKIMNMPTPTTYRLADYLTDVLRLPYNVFIVKPVKYIHVIVDDFDEWLYHFAKKFPSLPCFQQTDDEEYEDEIEPIPYGQYINLGEEYQKEHTLEDLALLGWTTF